MSGRKNDTGLSPDFADFLSSAGKKKLSTKKVNVASQKNITSSVNSSRSGCSKINR